MILDVHTFTSEAQTVEVNDSVFACKRSTGSVYHSLRNELANRRVGTAKTKTRSEISGGERKPWRQKGLGRARAGTRRSPLWRGGGTVFGPVPRDYSYQLPKKMRRLAIRSLLSQGVQESKLTVLEDFSVTSGKTKDFIARVSPILPNNVRSKRILMVVSAYDESLKRAISNLYWLKCLNYARLNVHDLLYADLIVVFSSAAVALSEFYSGVRHDS